MKSRILTAGIAVVIAAVIAIGAFGAIGASAQAPRPTQRAATAPTAGQPVRLMGKVSSVTATSLVLATRNGDVTVNISDKTFITISKDGQRTTATATDLATDKATLVVGTATADPKVVDARLIGQGNAARFLANHPKARRAVEHTAAGTITAINGNTITLQGVKVANVTVETTANTIVLNNGFTTVSSLKVGDKVAVLGRPDRPATTTQAPDSRTITAWGLRVENDGTKLSMTRVSSISGNTLTVKTVKDRDGVTIQLDANTAYKKVTVSPADRSASVADASQADIQVGSNLVVEGVASADGKTITAKAVIILPKGNRR